MAWFFWGGIRLFLLCYLDEYNSRTFEYLEKVELPQMRGKKRRGGQYII